MPRPVTVFTQRPGFGLNFHPSHLELNRVRYTGPLPLEWEDSGMDREWGALDALDFVRRTDFAPSSVAFDAAFAQEA